MPDSRNAAIPFSTTLPAVSQESPWKTLSGEVRYENKWIRVTEHDVINPAGKPGIYGVVHMKSTAIGVLPIDAEGCVHLVGQYRYSLNAYSWEMPEGGGALDVEPIEEAMRELREETGVVARQWSELLRLHTSNSICDEHGVIYLAWDLEHTEAEPEDTEALTVARMPFATCARSGARRHHHRCDDRDRRAQGPCAGRARKPAGAGRAADPGMAERFAISPFISGLSDPRPRMHSILDKGGHRHIFRPQIGCGRVPRQSSKRGPGELWPTSCGTRRSSTTASRPPESSPSADQAAGNQRDLALAYSPGVAAACEAIVADPAAAATVTAAATWSPSSPTAPPCWASAPSARWPPSR